MLSPMNSSIELTEKELERVEARAQVMAREAHDLRKALVRIRRDKNLTQQQVADLLGVSQQAIQKLERYDNDPRLSTLERYANAIGAIITHEVSVDNGKSIRLASQSEWVPAGQSHPIPVPAHSSADVKLEMFA